MFRASLAAAFVAVWLPVAAGADPTLVVAVGKVEVGRGTPPVWHVARSGERLAPGDSVRTAAGARAELELGDHRIARVYEQSLLRVGTSVTPTGAVRSVDLDEGRSIFDVMKKTVADEFDVVTPEIVVSVKGTRFLVAAAAGADYTSVFRGVVGLAGKGFDAVNVRPGMTGSHGELFLTPFADPWAAWETGGSPPEPEVDEGHHEVGAAVQAAVGAVTGSGDGSGGGSGGGTPGLVGEAGGAVGGVVAPVAKSGAAAAGVVGGAAAPLLEPVGNAVDPVVNGVVSPVVNPVVNSVVNPVLTPVVTPVSGVVGGVLGSNARSP